MSTRVTSIEDGKLDQVTLVTTRTREYRDFDLSFARKPSGELYIKKDAAAVKQAVKNLLLTNYFEKPFLPFFGGNLIDMLFELADDTSTSIYMEERIVNAIEAYEPRASVLEVKVDLRPDNNSVDVRVVFQVINTSEVVTFTTVVSRLR